MTMSQFLSQHPFLFSALTTWFAAGIVTAFVGLMPAPTKDSTRRYVLAFKLANGFIGNLARARSTSLESSPNWHDAVDRIIRERMNETHPRP